MLIKRTNIHGDHNHMKQVNQRCHDMAVLAQMAYLEGKEAKALAKTVGYTGHKFFDAEGAQCHVVWNKEEYVMCFRGTEPDQFSDIMADLNAWPDKGVNGGRVHNGFQNEIEKIWEPLKKHYTRSHSKKLLYICGHSLGGAMATVAAYRMNDIVDGLFTYGSPRVGTRSYIKQITCPHFRHVNNNDIVPSVPPALFGYKHHGTLRYINYYGNIRELTWWQRLKDQWRGRWRALKKGVPFDGVYDHGMQYYVDYTDKNK